MLELYMLQGRVCHHCCAAARRLGRHVSESAADRGAVWVRGGLHGGQGQSAE